MLSFKSKSKKRWPWIALIATLVIVPAVYVGLFANLPLPAPAIEQNIASHKIDTGQNQPIVWPNANQAAVYVPEFNIKQSSGPTAPKPTASVAKAITALALLQKSPLQSGEPGPQITMTQADANLYNEFLADGGSVFAVSAGQNLSQYQAMQALLLPSANNMAVTLTRWAFGSDEEYLKYANQMVKDLGMHNTSVADASGFSEKTTSTAEDLVILGKFVHDNPVLAEIVNQKSATILGREVKNVNTSLGVAGIDGIKTGFTYAAGGCLLFSSTQQVFGKPTVVIGAILGAQTRDVAIAAAPKVVESSFMNFTKVEGIAQGQTIATVSTAWGQDAKIISDQPLTLILWKGDEVELQIDLNHQNLTGQAKLADKVSNLSINNTIKQPDLWWRLTHPQILLSNYVQSL